MKFTLREKRFPSATGLCDIRYRMWIPEDPHAALQITHGMAEHIDRYEEFASFLAENGILVYGNDIVSHGKSIRDGVPKGYFGEKNGWDNVVQDMRTMRELVKADFPGIPFILLGHSMGSFLARTYAGRDGADFDAFIFSGTAGSNPVLAIGKLIAKSEIKKTGGKLPSVTLFNMSFGSYNKAFRPNRTVNDWLSRDNARVDAYVADENCGFPFTAHAMYDVFTGLTEISNEKWAKRVPQRPILVMSGAMDPVGSAGKGPKQVYGWLKKSGHNVELKLYENGRHEMLNEINRKDVYNDILLFINTVEAMGEVE
ncbi:MAG TPA: alpha/beta fold hydrolase [Candidatus Cryosericum sp.]|nr:alpha/beta fold hydrolase [Candidatus Cryosericum sp.]